MKTIIFDRLTSFILLILMVLPALGQSGQPGAATSAQNSPETELSRENCDAQIQKTFDDTLQTLRLGPPADLGSIRDDLRRKIEYGSPDGFAVVAITVGERPIIIAGFSCPVSQTDFKGAFQIFAMRNGEYKFAANSDDFAVMSQTDMAGFPISMGFLMINSVPGTPGTGQLITRWIRSGGAPAPFSVVVWNWADDALQPIWNMTEVKRSSSEVIGSVLMIQQILSEGWDHPEWQAYRVGSQRVLADGPVDKYLLARYLDGGIIQPHTPREFALVGTLVQELDGPAQALPFYDKALTEDASHDSDFLYLLVADLQENLGLSEAAISTLKRYQNKNQGNLRPDALVNIESRVKTLQSKVRGR